MLRVRPASLCAAVFIFEVALYEPGSTHSCVLFVFCRLHAVVLLLVARRGGGGSFRLGGVPASIDNSFYFRAVFRAILAADIRVQLAVNVQDKQHQRGAVDDSSSARASSRVNAYSSAPAATAVTSAEALSAAQLAPQLAPPWVFLLTPHFAQCTAPASTSASASSSSSSLASACALLKPVRTLLIDLVVRATGLPQLASAAAALPAGAAEPGGGLAPPACSSRSRFHLNAASAAADTRGGGGGGSSDDCNKDTDALATAAAATGDGGADCWAGASARGGVSAFSANSVLARTVAALAHPDAPATDVFPPAAALRNAVANAGAVVAASASTSASVSTADARAHAQVQAAAATLRLTAKSLAQAADAVLQQARSTLCLVRDLACFWSSSLALKRSAYLVVVRSSCLLVCSAAACPRLRNDTLPRVGPAGPALPCPCRSLS